MTRFGAVAAGMAALASAALGAGNVWAADLPGGGYQPYSVGGTFSWMGPYVGGNLGYEWGSVSNGAGSLSGLTGGLEGGYNWQRGQFVFGGEADLQLSGANDTFAGWKFSNPWFGTVRARAGFAMNNLLFYGTAGLAYGGLEADMGAISESHALFGWTAGGGMEIGFTSSLSAKVEYLYVNLGSTNFGVTGLNNGLTSGILRFGVNYHF